METNTILWILEILTAAVAVLCYIIYVRRGTALKRQVRIFQKLYEDHQRKIKEVDDLKKLEGELTEAINISSRNALIIINHLKGILDEFMLYADDKFKNFEFGITIDQDNEEATLVKTVFMCKKCGIIYVCDEENFSKAPVCVCEKVNPKRVTKKNQIAQKYKDPKRKTVTNKKQSTTKERIKK